MASALIDSVLHWRRKLDKDPNDDYILNVIRKLSKVPITLEILEATHIGKTVRRLSKRDDIVGEKAKTVLNKWRDIFINQGSDKNQKLPNDSKKENVNKESKSSNEHSSSEKTVSQKQASHNNENKRKNNSLSSSLFEQPSQKYVNGSCSMNSSIESSHTLYKYNGVTEVNSNYMYYDPHTESSEGYDPECPELFPMDKPVKAKKPILLETYEPSSMKCKLTTEKEQHDDESCHKKMKSNSHLISNSDTTAESNKSEKKVKHNLNKQKTKDNCYLSTLKNKCNKVKLHNKNTKRHKSAFDTKKTKYKESSESDRTKSKKIKIHSKEEFTSSEVSFEDCLGFNDIVSLKKNSKSHSSVKKQFSNTIPSKEKPTDKSKKDPEKCTLPDYNVKVSKDSSLDANKRKVSKDLSLNINKSKIRKHLSHPKKERPFTVPKPATKLDIADITSTLPEIQPNYRPLPRSPEFYAPKKKEVLSNEEAIKFTSSRREKTAVYSGRKTGVFYTEVPRLFEICTRVLIENIDAIECVGDATYDIMKPILERCSPSQLYNIENYNPDFIENTNNIWEIHCKRDYKLLSPMEHETWRELYWRAHDERERKFKCVTANISASMFKSTPVRQVKLAYVESYGYVKPPRDIARKQAKHGTSAPINHVIKSGSPSKQTPRPFVPPIISTTTSTNSATSTLKKPKIAPLMAKTLKSMKAFRRK